MIDSWKQLCETATELKAVIEPNGNTHSRSAINTRSKQLAVEWKQQALKPHHIIALHTTNSVEWISSFIAALYLDAVIVPIDFNISDENALTIAQKAGATHYSNGKETKQLNPQKPRRFQRKDIILGKLTSGSTGDPKLLFFSDSELRSDGERIITNMGITADDINLGVIPWGHSYGIGNIVIPFLIQGTAFTWTTSPLPNDIATTIEKTKATVFPAVPALLKALNRSNCSLALFQSLRLVISAGARLLPEIAQNFHDSYKLIPHNFYGSSETGGICYDQDGLDSLTGNSIGKIMTGVQLEIARDGRFYVTSPSVFTYRNPVAKKDGQGRCLMVDRATIAADNSVNLGNRAKGFAKIGGKRIALNEIEEQLKSIDGINDAIVIELSSESDSTLGTAIESKLPLSEITKRLHDTLPRRLRPKSIKIYQEFPLTPRGKTNLAQIRSSLENQSKETS